MIYVTAVSVNDVIQLLVAVAIVELIAVLFLALYLVGSPGCCHEHAIPDFLPDGFGGDRPQTNPAARPRSSAGLR